MFLCIIGQAIPLPWSIQFWIWTTMWGSSRRLQIVIEDINYVVPYVMLCNFYLFIYLFLRSQNTSRAYLEEQVKERFFRIKFLSCSVLHLIILCLYSINNWNVSIKISFNLFSFFLMKLYILQLVLQPSWMFRNQKILLIYSSTISLNLRHFKH